MAVCAFSGLRFDFWFACLVVCRFVFHRLCGCALILPFGFCVVVFVIFAGDFVCLLFVGVL